MSTVVKERHSFGHAPGLRTIQALGGRQKCVVLSGSFGGDAQWLPFLRLVTWKRTGTGMHFSRDVVIVGGCGRVGLPVGLAFADAGLSVMLYDRDASAVDLVRSAKMP